jgi:N-acetylneuraminic acid mutarotase
MPTPRINLAIAAYDGKIYCMSGGIYPEDHPEIGAQWRSNVVEIYDIATNSWSTAKSPASFTGSGQAHVVNGKIFVIVGNALHTYDPTTDVWTKTDAPLWLFYLASAVIDNKIILTGNIITEMKPVQYALKTIIYDPKTDVWSEGKTETTLTSDTCSAGATTGSYAPQKIYLFSGTNNNLIYEPATDSWSTAKETPANIDISNVAVIDDVLYVISGTKTIQYIPIGYGTLPAPSVATPTPTNILTTSEPEPSKSHLTYIIITTLVITVGIIGSVVFYFNKKKRMGSREITTT